MLRLLLVLVSLALSAPAVSAQGAFSAAAFVNDAIITQYDVDQRARLMGVLGAPKDQARAMALQSLVDEKLKREAARRAGVGAPPEALDQALQAMARRLRTEPDKLTAQMRGAGVSDAALREFLEADVLWGATLRQRFGQRVEVTAADVDAEIAGKGLSQRVGYQIAEIGIPAGNQPGRAEAQLRQIAEEARGGASFQDLARKHSRSPTRDKGGVIGWVAASGLPPAVATALAQLEPGGVTQPLPIRGGFIILALLDKRIDEVTVDGETREQIRLRLLQAKLESFAATYLEELRAAAYIEEK